jgi:hypothetical protein
MMKVSKKDESKKVVHELGHNDVLLGRGAGSINYVGNVLFREIVKERRDEYLATSKRQLKDAIAREIVQAVTSRKGRFLRKIVSDDERKYFGVAESDNAWSVADYEKTLEKVKQSLRDREYSPIEGECVKSDSSTIRPHKVDAKSSCSSSRALKPLSIANIATNGDDSSRGQSRLNPLANNGFTMYQETADARKILKPSTSCTQKDTFTDTNTAASIQPTTTVSLQDPMHAAVANPYNSSEARQQMSLEDMLRYSQSPNMNNIASLLMLNPHLLSLAAGIGSTPMLNGRELGLDQHLMLQQRNRLQQQYQVPTDFTSLLIRQQQEHLLPTMLTGFGSHIGNNMTASPLLSNNGMGMSTSLDNDKSTSSQTKRKKTNDTATLAKKHKKHKNGN